MFVFALLVDSDVAADAAADEDNLFFVLDCPTTASSFKCPHLATLKRYKNCTSQNLRCRIGPSSSPMMNCGTVSRADRKDDSRMTKRTNVDIGVIKQEV